MFSLSGPFELLFLLCFCLLDLSCGDCDVISLYFICCSGNLSVYCVFVNCLVKQFAICLGVAITLLLNVMEVFSLGGGTLLDRSQCASKCSFHRFCLSVCMSAVIS